MSNLIERVLLVDDDPDDAFLLQRALQELGRPVQLQYVEDCDEVVAAVTARRPQLIFMDINMPKRNGLECLSDWSRQPAMKDLPVVVYSSSSQERMVGEAYRLGAVLYLRKPSTFSELIESLRMILSFDWSDPAGLRARYHGADASRVFSVG